MRRHSNVSSPTHISLVAKVMLENAYLKYPELQKEPLDDVITSLARQAPAGSPVLRFPKMDCRLTRVINKINPTVQIFGDSTPLSHGSSSTQDMLMRGHIILSKDTLAVPYGRVPAAALMEVVNRVNAKDETVRLSEVCSIHPEIDHLPLTASMTTSVPTYLAQVSEGAFDTCRFQFIEIHRDWNKTITNLERAIFGQGGKKR